MADVNTEALRNAVAVVTAGLVQNDEALARTFLEDLDIHETRDVVMVIIGLSAGAFDGVAESLGAEPTVFWADYLKRLGMRATEL